MNGFEFRMRKLLKVLIERGDFSTLREISDEIGVSKRSIQNYLNSIEKWFTEYQLHDSRIEKKPGRGVRLQTSFENRTEIEKLLKNSETSLACGNGERRVAVLRLLLFSGTEVTIQSLMEKFYVSRPVIVDDLKWVSEWLSQFSFSLYKIRRRGIVLRGNEVDYRNAVSGLFDLYGEDGGGLDLPRMPARGLSDLCSVYPQKIVSKIHEIIQDTELKYDFILSQDFFSKLVTHMVIAVSRIIRGNSVSKEYFPVAEKYPEYETNAAEYIAGRISDAFHIAISSEEKAYICMHLIGYNAFAKQSYESLRFSMGVEHLTMCIINQVDAELNTEFFKDEKLFWDLNQHLKTSLYRLKISKSNIPSESSALPRECMGIYRAVGDTADIFQKSYQVLPDGSELLEITWIFALAKRRINRWITALLVTNGGALENFSILKSIEKCCVHVMILDSCRPRNFEDRMSSRYDLILSTETLPNARCEYLYLGEFDSQKTGEAIKNFLKKTELQKNMLGTAEKAGRTAERDPKRQPGER